MFRDWYILKDGKILPATIKEWCVWFDNVENRRIEYTEEEDFCVSTVFLGMDHGLGYSDKALLFEVLIVLQESDGSEFMFFDKRLVADGSQPRHHQSKENSQQPF